jgi:hypothetical protein
MIPPINQAAVNKMKRSLALAIDILVKLGTCLAASVGCSSKNLPAPQGPENT